MNKLAIALLLTCLAPSMALAGGGSTKSKGHLKFTNTSSGNYIYVLVDAPFESLLDQSFNAAQFEDLGGRVLAPGESTTYSDLNSGNHRYVYASLPPQNTPDTEDFEDNGIQTINVRGGRTTTVNLR